jgi:CheY-like chemotaxis protein
MKILIVEDNPVNQTLMKKFMSKLSIGCEVAANGREAVDLFLKEKFCMIFMDCEMPIMDGFIATAKIRQLEEATDAHIPIVAVTAYTSEHDKHKCMESGMDFHIPKPVSLHVLKQIMETYHIL